MVSTCFQHHEAASIFPLMEGQAFEELKADIDAHGLREPIWLFEGKILDGRNRCRACQELGIEPEFFDWTGDDPFEFVVSLNLHRRHLTESQRAMVGATLKERFETEAKERQTANLRKGVEIPVEANLPQRENGRSKEKAADLVNVSPRSVESASKVRQNGHPDLIKAVENGAARVSAAAAVATLPKAEQAALVSEGPEAVKEKAKEIRTAKQEPEIVKDEEEDEPESGPPVWTLEAALKILDRAQATSMGIKRRGGFSVLAKAWAKDDLRYAEKKCDLIVKLYSQYRSELKEMLK